MWTKLFTQTGEKASKQLNINSSEKQFTLCTKFLHLVIAIVKTVTSKLGPFGAAEHSQCIQFVLAIYIENKRFRNLPREAMSFNYCRD